MEEERGHGNHWSILGDSEDVIYEAIENVVNNQYPDGYAKKVEITLGDEPSKIKADLLGITDVEKGMATLAIVACDIEDSNEIVSIYPVYRTTNRVEMTVVSIDKWTSGCEAIIKCRTENGEGINFFATDYFHNIDRYIVGKKLSVSLSGMAYRAEELPESERYFGYYGQDALDWINCTGTPPEMLSHDEETGEPYVRFCMDELTALLPLDSPFDDDAQFQSNVRSVKSINYLNVDFWVVSIYINRDPDIEIPLLIPMKAMPEKPKKGDPIRGFLWLQGRMA